MFGLYVSVDAVTLPQPLPPVTSTLPVGSRVAVWYARTWLIDAAADQGEVKAARASARGASAAAVVAPAIVASAPNSPRPSHVFAVVARVIRSSW
ncbi:hypothetical protein MFU01_59400 [Myxococcus fulvus]|uniref:Uncharacterized protein n=1 Tax=Myxococcus fulvus TaxID=33 RepID=A0A511TBD6_MYXFU|nr:hypothetical protein MFU01_59400 [Myxococcus fulvus]